MSPVVLRHWYVSESPGGLPQLEFHQAWDRDQRFAFLSSQIVLCVAGSVPQFENQWTRLCKLNYYKGLALSKRNLVEWHKVSLEIWKGARAGESNDEQRSPPFLSCAELFAMTPGQLLVSVTRCQLWSVFPWKEWTKTDIHSHQSLSSSLPK